MHKRSYKPNIKKIAENKIGAKGKRQSRSPPAIRSVKMRNTAALHVRYIHDGTNRYFCMHYIYIHTRTRGVVINYSRQLILSGSFA